MFERLRRELQELQKVTQYTVPIEADKDGYLDKECPNEECMFQFKVHEEDWKNLFQEERVYCPLCRHEAGANSWWTTEQIERSKQQVLQHVQSRINRAMQAGAREFNARQSHNGFIKLSMKVSGSRPYHYIVPVPAEEEMRLKVTCKQCNTRYAVIGSAFFCPCCGHNSAEETFDNSIAKIQAKLKNLDTIRKAVADVSVDEAETTCRSLVESSLNECVVAFQRFSEVTFSQKAPGQKVKFNAFQNLEIGGEYWKELWVESYTDWLSSEEYKALSVLFQRRHLLSHTEGIVDQKYIEKSGDTAYKVGQRIVVKEKDVNQLLSLILKIVGIIRAK